MVSVQSYADAGSGPSCVSVAVALNEIVVADAPGRVRRAGCRSSPSAGPLSTETVRLVVRVAAAVRHLQADSTSPMPV